MRLSHWMALAVLFGGTVTGDIVNELPPEEFDVKIGETVAVSIASNDGFTNTECLIQTPDGGPHSLQELDFIDVITEAGVDCSIKIKVTEEIEGAWTLISRATSFGSPVKRTLPFTINIVPGEHDESDDEKTESEEEEEKEKESEEKKGTDEDDGQTTWLTEIRRFTRTEQIVDVSLPNIGYDEICTVITPERKTITAAEIEIPGVKVQSKSVFVSCRISIGPLKSNLLGKWTLCGRRDGAEERRCQVVTIEWNSENAPHSLWDSRTQPLFNHPVNLNGILTPVVIGSGSLLTCHIVTPNGEDLVVLPETKYPGIVRAESSTTGCSIAIGPITQDMLGQWELYGMFRSGLNEVRLPMNFELYDTDNPYNQAYNLTVLDAKRHVINLGSTISVEVSGHGTMDSCEFVAPSGQAYQSTGKNNFEGVQFVNVEGITACRISIGPITEVMLGKWQIVGKFNDGNIFNERQLPFEVIREDPILSADTSYVSSPEGQAVVMSCSVSATVRYCYFRAQNGTVFSVTPGATSTYTEYVGNGFAAGECGVRFDGLLTTDGGRWSCHVGLLDTEQEQRAEITLHIFEQMRVRHYIHPRGLMLEADVETPEELEYCRFVRIDGLGFTSENVPNGYQSLSNLQEGLCALLMRDQTTLNLHPWTVAAKVHGQTEITRTSTQNLLWTLNQRTATVYSIYLFTVVMFILLATVLVGVSLGPKKNRKWTYDRVSRLSTNIRNSFRKQKPVGGV